jgi:hypothetical protein
VDRAGRTAGSNAPGRREHRHVGKPFRAPCGKLEQILLAGGVCAPSTLAPLQGFGTLLIQPAQARWICPLSSSYVFYKYIVVVVERAPACGQPRFSQPRRALAWPPSLCTTPCSRCCGNGDKSQPMRWSVDNSAVVPELSPALRTSRPVHQISSETAASALQTSASSYEFDSPHGSRHLGGTVLSRRCPSGPTFSRPHCPGEGD